MERSLGDRAVAEEGDRDAAVCTQLRGRGGADRDRQAGTDDAVGAEDPDRRVGDVHRAAPPAVGPAVASHQLGEHPERVEPLGEAVAVAAVRRGDHVGVTQRPAGADGRRLLADRQVHEARDLAVAIQRRHAFLEPADDHHPTEHLDLFVDRERRLVCLGPHSDRLY